MICLRGLLSKVRVAKRYFIWHFTRLRSSSSPNINMNSTIDGRRWPLVAVCQMTSTSNKLDNLEVCRELIERSSSEGAKMVFLPEAFDYIAESKEASVAMCESIDGLVITAMRDVARKCRVWLSLGGFHQKDSRGVIDRLRNSHVIINDAGDVIEVYDKIHLFDVDCQTSNGEKIFLKESAHTLRGERISPAVNTPIGKVGLAICYDIRFPEMSLALSQQMGAEILTFPSAFTELTGKAHWEILCKNRAIENQCYVIAAAQVGQHNPKRTSYGNSMIVDPWGSVIASCGNETGAIALAEINLDLVEKIRQEMPLNTHRRTDLYGSVLAISKPNFDSMETFTFGTIAISSAQQFLRTSLSVAFVNLKPVVPGHVLVSPLRSIARFADLSVAEITDLFSTIQKVQLAIEIQFNATSSTINIQDGQEAGQSISHLHVHVVPRRKGDFAKNDDIYNELNKYDVDDNRQSRSMEEMASEADILRKLLATMH